MVLIKDKILMDPAGESVNKLYRRLHDGIELVRRIQAPVTGSENWKEGTLIMRDAYKKDLANIVLDIMTALGLTIEDVVAKAKFLKGE